MKEGWTYKKLGDLFDITSSKRVFQKDWKNKGVPFFRAREIVKLSKQGYVNNDLFISEEMYEDYKKKYGVPQIGDILITGVGTLGTCYVVKDEKKFYYKDGNIIWLKKRKEIDSDYVALQFLCPYVKKQIYKTEGATVGTYTITNANNTEILVPSLSEQKKIVSRLDAAFSHIDELKANAEKQLSEARALFQKSLAKAMEPKEGWEKQSLGELCKIQSLLVNPLEDKYKHLLHVGGANIISVTGELVDLRTAEEEGLESGKFTFDNKDVLYNKIRPYLIKVARPDFSGLCSADMYPLTPQKSLMRDYLYYILVSRDFTDFAVLNSGRAGMPKLNRQALFTYKCKIPPLSEQQRIVERLDALSAHVRELEENQKKIISECDALKQALLRKVFE